MKSPFTALNTRRTRRDRIADGIAAGGRIAVVLALAALAFVLAHTALSAALALPVTLEQAVTMRSM